MVGVSRAPLYGIYPFVLGVNINGGAILPADVCVDVVDRLYVWYYVCYVTSIR